MNALTYLTEKEGRDFIHLAKNNKWLNTMNFYYSGEHEA